METLGHLLFQFMLLYRDNASVVICCSGLCLGHRDHSACGKNDCYMRDYAKLLDSF